MISFDFDGTLLKGNSFEYFFNGKSGKEEARFLVLLLENLLESNKIIIIILINIAITFNLSWDVAWASIGGVRIFDRGVEESKFDRVNNLKFKGTAIHFDDNEEEIDQFSCKKNHNIKAIKTPPNFLDALLIGNFNISTNLDKSSYRKISDSSTKISKSNIGLNTKSEILINPQIENVEKYAKHIWNSFNYWWGKKNRGFYFPSACIDGI